MEVHQFTEVNPRTFSGGGGRKGIVWQIQLYKKILKYTNKREHNPSSSDER